MCSSSCGADAPSLRSPAAFVGHRFAPMCSALDVSPLWLLGVSDDSGPMSADVALRARRVATGDEVVAALEDALARAKARVGGGDDDAAPEGAASV